MFVTGRDQLEMKRERDREREKDDEGTREEREEHPGGIEFLLFEEENFNSRFCYRRVDFSKLIS